MRRALVLLCFLWGASARAEGGGPQGRVFGVGVIVGSPTGLSGKYYLSPTAAVDAALGGALLGDQGLHVHADFLYHPFVLYDDAAGAFTLPFYFGGGLRILNHVHFDDSADLHLGLRVPVGIVFDFKNVPIDVFVEVALVVDFLHAANEKTGLNLNAGIGVRYYF
jgi:hypothetical protein